MTEGVSPGFGETLRGARLAAGRQLEELAGATRIPLRFLEALEAEDWSVLPEGVIGRGFVRLVARELSLPVEELLGKYREARPGEGAAQRLIPPEGEWKVDFRRERGPGPVLLTVLFLLGAALGIWVWSPWSVDIAPPVVEEPPSAPAEVTAPSPEEPPPQAPEAPSATAPEVAPSQPAETASATRPPAAEAAAVPALSESHRLEILAVEKVWVRVSVDGGRNRDRLLLPGQKEVLEARERATLRLGNAGGVRLSWDGEALKVPGTPGEVKSLVFPRALERLRP
jgi:cytoskeleton protein RodZ